MLFLSIIIWFPSIVSKQRSMCSMSESIVTHNIGTLSLHCTAAHADHAYTLALNRRGNDQHGAYAPKNVFIPGIFISRSFSGSPQCYWPRIMWTTNKVIVCVCLPVLAVQIKQWNWLLFAWTNTHNTTNSNGRRSRYVFMQMMMWSRPHESEYEFMTMSNFHTDMRRCLCENCQLLKCWI